MLHQLIFSPHWLGSYLCIGMVTGLREKIKVPGFDIQKPGTFSF
jgi:hypothetical protein